MAGSPGGEGLIALWSFSQAFLRSTAETGLESLIKQLLASPIHLNLQLSVESREPELQAAWIRGQRSAFPPSFACLVLGGERAAPSRRLHASLWMKSTQMLWVVTFVRKQRGCWLMSFRAGSRKTGDGGGTDSRFQERRWLESAAVWPHSSQTIRFLYIKTTWIIGSEFSDDYVLTLNIVSPANSCSIILNVMWIWRFIRFKASEFSAAFNFVYAI